MILPLASILQPLIDVADSIIKLVHDDVGFSWGLSIIALTFIVRLAVLPLSLRGIRSMRRMQIVAPKIQALKEKYKDDPQRFQRETMELYKKEGVNPFSSCLPFILQIPFFIAIYQLLRGDTFQQDVENSPPAGFLFVKSVIESPHGAELIVLIVLFVTTTAASVLLTTATSPTASPAQRYLMLLFPLIIVPHHQCPSRSRGLLDRDQPVQPRPAVDRAEGDSSADDADAGSGEGRQATASATPKEEAQAPVTHGG